MRVAQSGFGLVPHGQVCFILMSDILLPSILHEGISKQ